MTFSDSDGDEALHGLEEAELLVTVRNQGNGPGVDVVVLTDCIYPGIETTETVKIGFMAPQSEQSVRIPLKAGPDVADGTAQLGITTLEGGGNDARTISLAFPVVHLDKPQLRLGAISINGRRYRAVQWEMPTGK